MSTEHSSYTRTCCCCRRRWCIQLYLKRCFKNKYIPFRSHSLITKKTPPKKVFRKQKNLSVNQHPFPFFFFLFFFLSLRWDWCVCHHYYYYYFSLLRFFSSLVYINATSYHIASCFFTGANWFLFAFIANGRLLPLYSICCFPRLFDSGIVIIVTGENLRGKR